MKLKPLRDRVIVKRAEEGEKTKGGIVIPETAKETPGEGEVIAVGSGKVMDDGSVRRPEVKVGDRVIFAKYAGNEVSLEGEEYLVMREEEILGVIGK